MFAGSVAGFQPSDINQTDFLDSRRSMPWQQPGHDLGSQAERVLVAAGNNAGMVHVWAGTAGGHQTWQSVGVQQQVLKQPPLFYVSPYTQCGRRTGHLNNVAACQTCCGPACQEHAKVAVERL